MPSSYHFLSRVWLCLLQKGPSCRKLSAAETNLETEIVILQMFVSSTSPQLWGNGILCGHLLGVATTFHTSSSVQSHYSRFASINQRLCAFAGMLSGCGGEFKCTVRKEKSLCFVWCWEQMRCVQLDYLWSCKPVSCWPCVVSISSKLIWSLP